MRRTGLSIEVPRFQTYRPGMTNYLTYREDVFLNSNINIAVFGLIGKVKKNQTVKSREKTNSNDNG